MKPVNSWVRKLRLDNNLSIEQMGKILNKERSTYGYQELHGNFKVEELQIFCEHFKVPMSYFTAPQIFDKTEPDTASAPDKAVSPILKVEEPKPDFYKTDSKSDFSENDIRIIKLYRSLSEEKRETFFLTLLELFNRENQ